MYLCEQLIAFDQQAYPMVGAIPNQVQMQSKLSLGYRQVFHTQADSLLSWTNSICGHEFHHSQLLRPNPTPLFELQSLSQPHLSSFSDGFGCSHLHASYVHLHWGDKPFIPQQFVKACEIYASVHRETGI